MTLIDQNEGILNFRQLYPLSADLDEYDVLTFDHVSFRRPIIAVLDHNVLTLSDNRLQIWEKLTKIILEDMI